MTPTLRTNFNTRGPLILYIPVQSPTALSFYQIINIRSNQTPDLKRCHCASSQVHIAEEYPR